MRIKKTLDQYSSAFLMILVKIIDIVCRVISYFVRLVFFPFKLESKIVLHDYLPPVRKKQMQTAQKKKKSHGSCSFGEFSSDDGSDTT